VELIEPVERILLIVREDVEVLKVALEYVVAIEKDCLVEVDGDVMV
jgi:hypothetical protein